MDDRYASTQYDDVCGAHNIKKKQHLNYSTSFPWNLMKFSVEYPELKGVKCPC